VQNFSRTGEAAHLRDFNEVAELTEIHGAGRHLPRRGRQAGSPSRALLLRTPPPFSRFPGRPDSRSICTQVNPGEGDHEAPRSSGCEPNATRRTRARRCCCRGGARLREHRARRDPIKIGFPVPLAGPFGVEAQDQVRAAEIAVKEFNDAGACGSSIRSRPSEHDTAT